jgi:hypothetical protein
MVLLSGLVVGVAGTGCSGKEKSQAKKSAKQSSESSEASKSPDTLVPEAKSQPSDLPAKPKKNRGAEKVVPAGDSKDSDANGQESREVSVEPQETNIDAIALVSQPKRMTVRLPKFFSQLVNQQQREEIGRIQADYLAKIRSLEAELDDMRKAELQDMEQVLTKDQRKLLEKKRSQAEGKRSNSGQPTQDSEDSSDSDEQSREEPADPSAMDD